MIAALIIGLVGGLAAGLVDYGQRRRERRERERVSSRELEFTPRA